MEQVRFKSGMVDKKVKLYCSATAVMSLAGLVRGQCDYDGRPGEASY